MSDRICTPIGRRRWVGNAYFQHTKEGGIFVGADTRGTRNPDFYVGTYWPPEKVAAFLAFAGQGGGGR